MNTRWSIGWTGWTLALALAVAGCNNPPAPGDVTLDPPAKGFQLAVPPYDVPSGTEIQACYFFKVPDVNNGQPFYVESIQVAQNPGSHHMNIFRQNTIVHLQGPNPDGTGSVVSMNGTGECFKSSNWADWPLVVNTQATQTAGEPPYTLALPKPASGPVGWKFTPGDILMLQTHYVNANTQKTPGRGKVLANFNQMIDTTNAQELGTIFATHQSIAICQDNPNPSYTGNCHVNSARSAACTTTADCKGTQTCVGGGCVTACAKDTDCAGNQTCANGTCTTTITIVAANGHFHSRGRDFTICPWDGMSTDACTTTKFYESTTWDEPPMATGLNVVVPPGGGIEWTCTYQWEPSPACADGCSCLIPPKMGAPMGTCCYGFGGGVETSEHCNAFVYYYPRIDRTDITCQ
jgi:hypothetical protein